MLKELVRKGLDVGRVVVINNPNDDCISCQIGNWWFYFIDPEYENLSAKEVYAKFTNDELADMISAALEDLQDSEFQYYKQVLLEKGAAYEN